MNSDSIGRPVPAAWRRFLLLPAAARLGAGAPRDPKVGWNRFWGQVQSTGDGGDVLWDSSNPGELEQYLPIILRYLDKELPMVDLGCGNGRQSRVLARHYREVLAVDISSDAVQRAEWESAGIDNLRFSVQDLLTPDAAAVLSAKSGEANVFIRGVLHILPVDARLQVVEVIRRILGERGRLFLAETNYVGGSLGYLQHLGAKPGRIPKPLRRAIASLPKPRQFGPAELRKCFPASDWAVEVDGVIDIYTIPLRQRGASEVIPGYYAVLAPLPRPASGPGRSRPGVADQA